MTCFFWGGGAGAGRGGVRDPGNELLWKMSKRFKKSGFLSNITFREMVTFFFLSGFMTYVVFVRIGPQ